MKAEQAQQLTDQATAQLIQSLERGESASLTRFIAAMGRFHRYSFGNVMLIITQRPDASRVAGFNTWRSLGRFVKKGEKGVVIIAPMMIRKRDTESAGGEPSDTQPIVRFRAAHVFDVSQTDGDALPEPARVGGNPNGHTERLKLFIGQKSIALEYRRIETGADGLSAGGRIVIADGLSPAEEFSVLTHELAHEMLHHTGDRPASKTVRETEAEAVAHIVCSAIGLEVGAAASDYIRLYDGDKDTLLASLGRIQLTARAILEAIIQEPSETA